MDAVDAKPTPAVDVSDGDATSAADDAKLPTDDDTAPEVVAAARDDAALVPADDATKVTRVVRVLCLHGYSLSGKIFRFSLEPIMRAFKRRAPPDVKLELICANGMHTFSVADLREQAALDYKYGEAMKAEMAAIEAFEEETVYAWAKNNFDAPAWQFLDLPEALANVQSLLKEHSPIDGILGTTTRDPSPPQTPCLLHHRR